MKKHILRTDIMRDGGRRGKEKEDEGVTEGEGQKYTEEEERKKRGKEGRKGQRKKKWTRESKGSRE